MSTDNKISLTTVSLSVNGAEVKTSIAEKVVEIRIDAALGSPAQATVRFFDENFELFDDTALCALGATVVIKMNRAGGALQQVFSGELVALGTDQAPSGLHELVLTCYDKSHRMARNTALKTYQDQTYRDIAQQIAQRNGLTADVEGGVGTIKFEHLTQTTDDASFLNQICRRAGAHWRVDSNSLKVFAAKPGATVATLTWGEDLLRFRTRFSAAEVQGDITVRGWDPLSKVDVVGTAPAAPTNSGTSPVHDERNHVTKFGKAKRTTSRTVVVSQDEAEQYAKALRDRASTGEIVAKGETFGDPRLVAGSFIDIAAVGVRLKGTYFITSVEHIYSPAGYVTRFSAGPSSTSAVVDLVGSASSGGGALLTSPDTGLMIGLVTNNKDPDGHGRVRVKFPGESQEAESAWARVATFAAGNGHGASFMPQIDTEVIVMFEGGDRRRPIVLGSLWNGKDKPSLASDAFLKQNKVVQWQVRTATGQTLTFDESEDKTANVAIELPDKGTRLYLGKDKVELWSNNNNIEVKTGQASVLLKDGKDIIVKAMNVTIEATQALKLSGLTVEIAGKTTAKVEGQASLELKGGGSAKLSASGIAEVSGSLVKIN